MSQYQVQLMERKLKMMLKELRVLLEGVDDRAYRSCFVGDIAGDRADRTRRAKARSRQHYVKKLAQSRRRRGEGQLGVWWCVGGVGDVGEEESRLARKIRRCANPRLVQSAIPSMYDWPESSTPKNWSCHIFSFALTYSLSLVRIFE